MNKMNIVRYINKEKIKGPLPPLLIENPAILDVLQSVIYTSSKEGA